MSTKYRISIVPNYTDKGGVWVYLLMRDKWSEDKILYGTVCQQDTEVSETVNWLLFKTANLTTEPPPSLKRGIQ